MTARSRRIAVCIALTLLAMLAPRTAGLGAAAAQVPAQPVAIKAPAERSASHRILVLLRLTPDHFRPGASYGGGYGNGLSRSAARRVAQRIARSNALALVDDWPMPLLHLNCFVMTVPADRTLESAATQVETDPAVVWAQPMHDYETQGTRAGEGVNEARGDPMLAAQPVASAWHLIDLHRLATGRGVTVAIIDTQIERTHPDLVGQVAVARNFVAGHPVAAELHGTAVAGIIAARGDNGVGILGIAPGARLLALRACWQRPGIAGSACNSFSLAEALHYAIVRRVGVINLSLSGPPDRLLAALIALAQARGSTIVAAFDRDRADGGFPASAPGVIAVADAPFGTSLMKIYVAPGRDVLTTEPGGRWYLVNGSSYAAAHVSGLVALLRERSGGVVQLASVGDRIDACATLVRVSPACDCHCAIGHAVGAAPQR